MGEGWIGLEKEEQKEDYEEVVVLHLLLSMSLFASEPFFVIY